MAILVGEVPNTPAMESTVGLVWPHTHRITRSVSVRVLGLASDREAEIVEAPGMPRKFEPYSWDGTTDLTCRLIGASVKEYEHANHWWIVDLSYSNEASQVDELDKPPWLRTPKWRWASETEDLVLTKDAITGEPITNSAGDPFFITYPASVPVLTIDRFEQTFSEATILAYENHVNEETFWGAAPKAALLASITDDPEDVEGYAIRRLQYVIKFHVGAFDDVGWQVELLDHGPHYTVLDQDSGDLVKKPFTDAEGNPTTGNLDGSGNLNRFDQPVFVRFNRHPQADFADLYLGPSVWF